GFDSLLEPLERRLVPAVVDQILRGEHNAKLRFVVRPLVRHAAAVPHDVDDLCFRALGSEELLRFADAVPAVAVPAVARAVLAKQFVYPAVHVLVFVAEDALAVATMIFELSHATPFQSRS